MYKLLLDIGSVTCFMVLCLPGMGEFMAFFFMEISRCLHI